MSTVSPESGGPEQTPSGNSDHVREEFSQHQTGSAPKKKGAGCAKWGLILGGLLIGLFVIAGLVGGDDSESDLSRNGSTSDDEAVPASTQEVAQDSAASNDSNTFQVGETADLKGLNLTVENLRNDGADVFGNNHVCVDVTVQNDSSKAVDVSQFDFALTTPAGITVNSTFTESSDLQTATVNPGGSLAGTVCYESDGSAGEYQVGYDKFLGSKAAWVGQL